MRPALLTGGLGAALVAIASVLVPPNPPTQILGRAEAGLHDLVYTLAGPVKLQQPLPLLVDIDEATLADLRRPLVTYPPLLAQCTRNLLAHGYQRVAIDLSWRLDPGHNLGGRGPEEACRAGGATRGGGEDDSLADIVCVAVREAATTFLDPDVAGRVAFATILRAKAGGEGEVVFDRPPQQWCGSAACEAMANLAQDPHDGVVRRYDYTLKSRRAGEGEAESVVRPSLAGFLAGSDAKSAATEWLRPVAQRPVRLSFAACARGQLESLARASGASALIAACAAPLMDRHSLVASGDMCGAEIHLTAAGLTVAGAFVRPAPFVLRFLLGALAIVFIALGLRFGGGVGIAVGTLFGGLSLLAALPLAVVAGHEVPALPALFALVGTAIAATGTRLTTESRARRRLARAVGTYLPKPALNRILKRLDAGVLEGETVVAAVLFSDITGYTSIAERLTPAGTIALLNRHFQHLTDVAVAEGGWIEGYVGDQVVAYWPAIAGTDVPTPEEASRRAFAAALAILNLRATMLGELDGVLRDDMLRGERAEVLAHIRATFGYGIGVHAGPVVLGDMGSAHLKKFGIIGDTMNATSRIEALTRKLGSTFLLGEGAARHLPAEHLRPLIAVQLKGRGEPVRLYESALLRRPAGFDAALRKWADDPDGFAALVAGDPALAADPLVELLLRQLAQAPVLRFDEK
jgi:class 3 adenylate cyclase